MTDRPTRMVRARDLVKGATVVYECSSSATCSITAGQHVAPVAYPEPVFHHLTLLDAEEHDGQVTAICVSESGEQCSLHKTDWQPVRVFADSMPALQAES